MNESKDNIIVKKSYSFALAIIKLYNFLVNDKKEYVLSKQMLRSGTSIGLTFMKLQQANLKRFYSKVSNSSKRSKRNRLLA